MLLHDHVLTPDPAEREQIVELNGVIEHIVDENEPMARLVSSDGTEVAIPASAFHALQAIVRDMAQGLTITVIPHDKEITTKQAADMLNVSRQFLVRLLDRGDIPYHPVGTHRRLRVSDVLAYRERRAEFRQSKLDELTQASQDVEGGYR